MGIKFGEIDAAQIVENEFRIMVLEKVVDTIMANVPTASLRLDVRQIRRDVIEQLKKKYPNSGLEFKG